jgi:hypothetical protein
MILLISTMMKSSPQFVQMPEPQATTTSSPALLEAGLIPIPRLPSLQAERFVDHKLPAEREDSGKDSDPNKYQTMLYTTYTDKVGMKEGVTTYARTMPTHMISFPLSIKHVKQTYQGESTQRGSS